MATRLFAVVAVRSTTLPCQGRVLHAIEPIGQVTAKRVRLFVAQSEAVPISITEFHKPAVRIILEEVHIPTALLFALHSEPLRCVAPTMRLKRENKEVRVFENGVLLRHSNTAEPTKHIPICRESNNRDVRFPLHVVEKALVCEWIDLAIIDDVRFNLALHCLSELTPLVMISRSLPEKDNAIFSFSFCSAKRFASSARRLSSSALFAPSWPFRIS